MDLAKLPYRDGKRDREAPVMGAERQQFVDLLHGKHYADCLDGRVFSQAATPLGLAIPIYTGTALAGGMPVWNPKGSGVLVELISVDIGYGSGTADYGSVGLMYRKTEQSDVATGASVLTAFASTTPINGRLGEGRASRVKSSNAGTVTVVAGAAGDWVRTLASINLEAQTGTAHGTTIVHYDFDGTILVPPGGLVYLACTKASVALYATSVVWKEVDL